MYGSWAAMRDLEHLQERVLASPGAWLLLQADAALPFPEDAVRAAGLRFNRAWESAEDLTHALRGEGLTELEVQTVIARDRMSWDALITENDKREQRTNREKDAA